ncbi:hypothetical protein C0W40_02455 [Photobacterium leiognathi subsp. mandapamensis]|nr:hypothetical protein C0W40_02455 [Photobacterium leiognathi subsp. mandapamensis]
MHYKMGMILLTNSKRINSVDIYKKDSLKHIFMSRLEHTKAIFGYISLEAIVDGQLKQKINFNRVTLKKVYKVTYIHKNSSPILNNFKKLHKVHN